MNPNKFVETTGDSVEEAIAKGLAELGVGPSQVIVEVLEEPSRGVFGLGSRQAKVRLQLLTVAKPPAPPPAPVIEDEKIELPIAPVWQPTENPAAEIVAEQEEVEEEPRQRSPEHRAPRPRK